MKTFKIDNLTSLLNVRDEDFKELLTLVYEATGGIQEDITDNGQHKDGEKPSLLYRTTTTCRFQMLRVLEGSNMSRIVFINIITKLIKIAGLQGIKISLVVEYDAKKLAQLSKRDDIIELYKDE